MSDLTSRPERPPARMSIGLLAVALMLGAAMVASARADVSADRRDLIARADEAAIDAMAHRVASSMHLALAIEDAELAEQTAERLLKDEPHLQGVRIRFASGRSVSVGQFEPDALTRNVPVGADEPRADALELGADAPPLRANGATLGTVEVVSSHPSGLAGAGGGARSLAVTSSMTLLVVLGGALWLRRRLRRLTEAAAALSAGDFAAPTTEVGRDEIGWAAASLADLGAFLSEQVDRVHGRNAALLRDVTLKEDRLQRIASFASRLVAPLEGGSVPRASLEILCAEADSELGVLVVPPSDERSVPHCAALVGLRLDPSAREVIEGLPAAGPRPQQANFECTALSAGHPWMEGRNIPLHVARIPLQFQGRPQGVVVLARRLAWTEAERDFIRDAAHPFAIALANDRAFQASVSLAQALEERNDALIEQRDQLAVVDRLRSQFVANMSHELRTPLNAIMGYTELLADGCFGDVSDEQRTQLEHVLDASRHLLGLVNQVLDLSRAEAGAIDVECEPCDLRELATDVANLAEPLCRDRPYSLVVVGESLTVSTDRSRVQQIITNLVGNAIKFTPSGSVTLYVVAATDGGARIVVEDTGRGIDPTQAEMIFEEFRQVDGSSTRAHDGVGLGLAISRRLAHALGGTLEVQSAVGKGSSFTLSLPALAPLSSQPGTATALEAV